MPAPKPPVPLNHACSIIHNNILYTYSPDAFQILPLHSGAKWSQEKNGVSVTGAVCVKGGVDGDNNQTALYVVGGVANSSNPDYPGLQRWSIQDKSWQTITPVVKVTQHRQYHSAAYMNASSALIVYAGSQNGYTGASSETFLMEMYPPYSVQAYSSTAAPGVQPFMMPWSQDSALMAGGSSTNVNMFIFRPQDGFVDLGLALPNPLPDPSVAQVSLFDLDDGSRILQTFNLGQAPPSITTNVILNAGGTLAQYNETIGSSATTANPSATTTSPSKVKRAVSLNSYPTYDPSNAPDTTRTDFSLAQGGNGLIAFVGGVSDGSVGFFDQSGNSWVPATKLLGDQPQTTTSSTHTSTPTQASSTPSASSTKAAAAGGGGGGKHGLTILGGVLGGLCGLAAILIILLLWLRSRRRKQRREENKHKSYPAGHKSSADFGDEAAMKPLEHGLAHQGQPMGRSPVPSAVIIGEPGTTGMLSTRPADNLIRRVSSDANNRQRMEQQAARQQGNTHSFFYKKERNPPSISRPMNPNLGDYKERPSIDLGRATPAAPVNATPLAAVGTVPSRNKSQRKTDEAWAQYFSGDRNADPSTTYASSSPTTGRSNGGFWPGSGVPPSVIRSPRLPIRDSTDAELTPKTVASASPKISRPKDAHTRNLSSAAGVLPKISSGNSTSSQSDDGYEDQELDAAFSSGIPASVHDPAWTPVDNRWSGSAPQRPARPPSEPRTSLFAPPTMSSGKTSNTSGTQSSGIPSFPMPSSSIRALRPSGGESSFIGMSNVQHPAETHYATTTQQGREPSGYFSAGAGQTGQNDDMSWLNLGTPQPRP